MTPETSRPVASTSGERDSGALWPVPNALTLLRIFLVPLLVVVLLTRYEILGVVIFLAASFTDWLDGYLARRRRQITTLGQLLDPIADKLLISSAFISMVELGLAPAWMVVIIVGREIAVTGLRAVAARQGVTVPSSGMGKYKMGAQVVAVPLLIVEPRILGTRTLGVISLWVVVLLSMVAAIHYFVSAWGRIGLDDASSHE